jgi:hypothetical protein
MNYFKLRTHQAEVSFNVWKTVQNKKRLSIKSARDIVNWKIINVVDLIEGNMFI